MGGPFFEQRSVNVPVGRESMREYDNRELLGVSEQFRGQDLGVEVDGHCEMIEEPKGKFIEKFGEGVSEYFLDCVESLPGFSVGTIFGPCGEVCCGVEH